METDCVSVRAANSKEKTRPRKRSGTMVCSSAEEKTHNVPVPRVRMTVANSSPGRPPTVASQAVPAVMTTKPRLTPATSRRGASPSQRRISSGPTPVPTPAKT